MATGEEECASVHAAKPIDNPVGPARDGRGGVAAGTAISKELPTRPLQANLSRCLSFIGAIVPFDKLVIYGRDRPETGQRASTQSPFERAGEHVLKIKAFEAFTETVGITLASLGER